MSDIAEYDSWDGLGMAELVRARQLHPGELLEAALERAARWNPHLNALSASFPDRARAAIADGLPDGPFQGVPFLLKSLSAMLAGAPSTLGSRLFADFVSDHDSTLVERYKRAGLVIFGMTTTPEMGLSASTETSFTGTTRNPWNLAHSPGGSSGGSGAAVAAGIVPFAHGSDGGGSIRIPASACGLFGLKPTRGRTPSGPMAGEGWGSLATSHVISRSVRDSAAALDATHGPAPGDPYCAPPVGESYLSASGTVPGRLKVALQLEPLSGVSVAPECHSAAFDAAKLLEALGHHVEEARPEGSWEELQHASWVLVASNVRLALRRRAQALGRTLSAADVDRVTWAAVEDAASMTAEAYAASVQTIHRHSRRMAAFHQTYDILLSPTLATPPVPLGAHHMDNPDPAAWREAMRAFSPFTSLFNMSGQPAMSVPLAWSDGGLPIGVMFAAGFGEEATLFRLAGQLEAARPWMHRRPSLPTGT
ncbi:amidase [Reyranella sp.]|uniref:amidase n=1 Tax=Reyranella sp. TaxID=1929291 RepID=UPI0012088975|nr:amidase [Reyranella sp.]TAJ90873.1 MAG: amidase [Reyranella sp.]